MNAVAEARPAVSVVLLGPADAAREQLRQALVVLGADLLFEGEVRDGNRLTAAQAPQVLIVNLEPGVEDDLDALQELLDNPATSVVFNEGEVSSQLTGWDLARWARHLAAKVLGVRDTLPPPPLGAERLPELALLPEPGRPASPSQQQDHLKFDDYAEEALGHSDEVPASLRLELEPEKDEAAPTDLPGLDFDFSPVQSTDASDSAEPAAPAVAESDHLESMDLSSLFEQDLGEVSPDDMLFKLQQAMGLDPAVPDRPQPPAVPPEPVDRAFEPAAAGVAPSEAHQGRESLPSEADADSEAAEPQASVQAPSGAAPVEDTAALDFSWDAPASDHLADGAGGPASESLSANEDIVLDFSLALDDSALEPVEEAAPGSIDGARPDAQPNAQHESARAEDPDSWSTGETTLSFDPVAFESEEGFEGNTTAREPALDALESTEDDTDLSLSEFDFSAFDAAVEPRAEVRSEPVHRPDFDADDAALGGTLTLDSNVDDEEIAKLAAALDEQPSLPSAADLPPLEFDFARRPEPEPAAAKPTTPVSAASAPLPATRPTATRDSKAGFGELSLQPMGDGFIDSSVKAPEAPAQNFDFSHLTLSLEPLEADMPAAVKPDADAVHVGTMRDGAWLRDIGEGPAPEPPPAATEESATAINESPEDAPGEDGYAFFSAGTAQPPPLPASAVHAPSASRAVAPLTQGISRVVVLCASIGGPDALRSFLAGIPAGFPALFVVVQHLENGYFERLAQQLQKASPLPVRVPMAGLAARDGEVLVVASGARFLLAVDGQIELGEPAEASRYRPCIDDVLCDIADTFGPHSHAIIFSGMAADAVEGAVHLTRQGGEVWAQDPESCVVSSMVDGARSRGVVEFIGSPRELADHCVRRFGAPA